MSLRARNVMTLSVLAVAAVAVVAYGGSTSGPDVTVIYLGSLGNFGGDSTYVGYSVGTTSCNIGNTPVTWCNTNLAWCSDEEHPVIAQNLYRLKDGRFEQVGMSWLKHGFLSTNTPDGNCGSCASPPHGGDQLGVGCTDTYGWSLNGSRPLGKRSEVNASTAEFPFPYGGGGASSQNYDQRIKVLRSDVDPTVNPGARFWIEGHYLTQDDAQAGNGLNNASYREVTVASGTLALSFTGGTIRELAAISAWPVADPTVELVDVDVPGAIVERFHVARKVTDLGDGNWHYEYAVHNMNSDRSAQSFTVAFPAATTISNVGFHDVDHHSGEIFGTADWTPTVGTSSVSWTTDDFAVDANANALRFGTMFSFWFDATRGQSGIDHTLGLFKPGTPGSVTFGIGAPAAIFADSFESGTTSAWTLVQP